MLAALFVVLVVLPLAYMWNGYVLSVLWEWFVVPLGIAPISVAHAIGLAVIIGLLTSRTGTRKDDREAYPLVLIALVGLGGGLIALIVGAIAHAAM